MSTFLVMPKGKKKASDKGSSCKKSPLPTLLSVIVEILRSTTSNLSTGDILERSKSFKLPRPYTKHKFSEGVLELVERNIDLVLLPFIAGDEDPDDPDLEPDDSDQGTDSDGSGGGGNDAPFTRLDLLQLLNKTTTQAKPKK